MSSSNSSLATSVMLANSGSSQQSSSAVIASSNSSLATSVMLANSGSTSQQSSSAVIASSNSSLASVAKSVVTHEVKAPKSSIMELMITDLRQLLEIRKVEFQKLLNLRRAVNYENIDICSTEIQALLQLHPDIIDPKTCLLNSNI